MGLFLGLRKTLDFGLSQTVATEYCHVYFFFPSKKKVDGKKRKDSTKGGS